MRSTVLFMLSVLLSCCVAELDINVIILDDRYYNATRFEKVMSEFDPSITENGTVRKILPNPPKVQALGFINPSLCVGKDCFTEAAGSTIPSTSTSQPISTSAPQQTTPPPQTPPPATPAPATPSPTSSQSDLIVIAVMVSSLILVFLGISCHFVVSSELRRRTRLTSCVRLYHSHRVVIRETIEWPMHSAPSLLC